MTYLYAKIWKTLHRKNLLNGGGRAEDYGGVGQVWSLTQLVPFLKSFEEVECDKRFRVGNTYVL